MNSLSSKIWISIFFLALGVIIFGGAAGANPIDRKAEAGGKLAQQWCAECHLVAESGTPVDMAPSFSMMANHKTYTETRLRAWLLEPHSAMQGLELSGRQIDELIAYIDTLGN